MSVTAEGKARFVFNRDHPGTWARVFADELQQARSSQGQTGESAQQEGKYGNLEDVERQSKVVEIPVVARRGIAGVVDNWNGMDREHKITTVATVAVLGVIGVEAAIIAKDIIGPGVENVRRGLETLVYNGTCAGSNKDTCGIVTVENIGARLIGAGFDWLSMPKKAIVETRALGIPSGDAFWKTLALGVEEWKVGAVWKTARKGLSTLWRLKFSSQPQPKNEE